MSDQKRWDQYGRYTANSQAMVVVDATPPTFGPVPVSFGNRDRAMCAPAAGVAVTALDRGAGMIGIVALRIDRDTGVYREMAAQECRSMADGLLRLAAMLEGKAA